MNTIDLKSISPAEFAKGIKDMPIGQVQELVAALAEEFGIDPSATIASGPSAGAGGAAQVEEVAVAKPIITITSVSGLMPTLKALKQFCEKGAIKGKATDVTLVALKQELDKLPATFEMDSPESLAEIKAALSGHCMC